MSEPKWQPIETAPMDGSEVFVRRVHNGRVVSKGWAVFATLHPDAPSLKAPAPDPLGRPEVAAFNAEEEKRRASGAWRDTPKWLLPDRMYLFPEPTHWAEEDQQEMDHLDDENMVQQAEKPPRTVACVIDFAQRAHDLSGEPVELSVRLEVLDGVPHVRLVTDPASVLLPLSAFRIVSEWIAKDECALAEQANGLSRADQSKDTP